MATTRRSKRKQQPHLGHFMLWALTSWFLQKSRYRKTHNPFATPASRPKVATHRPPVAKRAASRPAAKRVAPKVARPKPAPEPKPMYGRYDPENIIDAEIIDEVASEDISIDPEPEPEGDFWMEPIPAAIAGGSGD